MRLISIVIAAAAGLGSVAAYAQAPATIGANLAESAEVEAAVREFASAFAALDKVRFDRLWASDATAFFPQHPFPIRRVEGKAAVTQWFHRFMDARKGKPMTLDPKDLLIQRLGDAAVATFHLGSSEQAAGRRTLVLRREAGAWKIVHLHASSLTIPTAERG